MRYLALVTILAACAGPLDRSTLPSNATPAHDLAGARTIAQHGGDHDTKLDPRDPRVVDLDIIRITAHRKAPGGEVEMTSVASADLFKEANAAAKERS